MPISAEHRKQKTNTMKAYQKQRQYIYRHCQLCHVTPNYAVIVGVCLLMLPVLELATEHVQLATMYYRNLINHVHPRHMTFSYTNLLSYLSNVLPAMVFQNRVAWSNVKCLSHASSHSKVCRVSLNHAPSSLTRRVVWVVVLLLLLISGDIETNPGPVGNKLTLDDLGQVMEEVLDVSAQWYHLGLQLKVRTGTLDRIRTQFHDPRDQLLEMLKSWLTTSDNTSWTTLTDALRSRSVGATQLAGVLETKCSLVKQTEVGSAKATSDTDFTSPPLPPVSEQIVPQPGVADTQATLLATSPTISPGPSPHPSSITGDSTPPKTSPSLRFSTVTTPPHPSTPGPTRPHTVEDRVKYFEGKFGNLIDRACGEVKGKIEPHIFLSRVTYLPVSARPQHRSFIEEKLTNISPPVTFENIWSILNLYWDFLNYGLLEHVINKCGSEDLKQQMQDYVDELSTFKQTTRLCDFIESWPCRDEGPPEDRLKKVVIKMDHEWSQCTLHDVESFKKALVHKFFLPEFDIILQKAERGCVRVTWLTSPSIATLLQQNLANIETELFKKHDISAVTIEPQEREKPSVGTLPEKLHSFKPGTSEVKTLKETHQMRLAEEMVSEMSTSMVTSEKIQFGTQSGDTQQAPNTSLKKTLHTLPHTAVSKHLTTLQLTPHTPEISPGWLETSTPTGMYSVRKFSIYLGGTKPKSSHPMSSSEDWLDPLVQYDPDTLAEKYVREECVDEISPHVKHVKLLPSVEQYLSEAELEVDPSLPTKYKDYLSSTPSIRAALYTTFNAKMAAEVFTWSLHTESPPPTTMTELFTAFTLKSLVNQLSTHPVHHKQQLKVTTFSDLPTDVYKQFQDLCRIVYEGILNRQQLVFSVAHLPTGFAPLGLMQEVPAQLYSEGRASSYHFIHLTLQEYLAAVHISQLPVHEQTRIFQEHINSGHFKMTMRFLAGCTKLTNIPADITMDTKLNYFHFLFEAKDISMTTLTLGLDEIVVWSHHSWTPLDYYVTGHAISHSNCHWRLNFLSSCIDDEKFEMFSWGCAARGTGCRGYISHVNFRGNFLTSKSIQTFVNIPPYLLQDIRLLDLSYNNLDGSACDLLAKVVPSMSRLGDLLLDGNQIGTGGTVDMIKALCSSRVEQLLLYDTGIGVPDCEALCELLKSSHSLQHLYIHSNNLSSESVASIITGLSHNSSLTHLVISNSLFSMVNVDSLTSVLKDHSECTLMELDFEDCHISSEGAVELMAALFRTTTLEHLDLSSNPIGEHVAAIAKMLAENKTLTVLYLLNCQISTDGAVELAGALCKNSTLKYLDLDHNPIGVEGASSMSDMLQHNTSLEVLYLCDDSVGEEGVHQLINSLKHNQTLRELWLAEKYESETSDDRTHWW